MQITGKILAIGEKKTSGAQGQYCKQEVMIDTIIMHDGKEKHNPLRFLFSNASCDRLQAFSIGQEVSVEFWPEGYFYGQDGKHWQDLKAWGIRHLSTPAAHAEPARRGAENYPDLNPTPENVDDLPL